MLDRPARSRVTETARSTTAATGEVGAAAASGADAKIGAVLGPYRIEAVLGEGGMGWVFQAEHMLLGRRVAIKLLRPEQAGRRSAVARFFQEARLVNRIRHRNIVDVPDLVELPDGTVFIVMELLRGESLKELLARGPLDVATALAIAAQIGAALAAAHAVGVLHRDLKPANVHIGADRAGDAWVKLLDFGIAKLSDAQAAVVGQPLHVTGEGAIIGTPAYMSPEQATSGPVDARSDLYSLGVILFELLAGHPPYAARTLAEYVRAHCSAPVPALVVPGGRAVPPSLAAVIQRCLAKDPDARPASVAEVNAAIAASVGELEPADGIATPAIPTAASVAALAGTTTSTTFARPRRWRGVALLAALGLTAALATGWAMRGSAAPVEGEPRAIVTPPSVAPPTILPSTIPPSTPPPSTSTPPNSEPPAAPPPAGAIDAPPRRTSRGDRSGRRDAAKASGSGAGSATGIRDRAYTTNPFESP
ncbi:MAG: serine/threonine protein kinase [Deltaproteobacteria bacterium]|nr:serine/threonine protein kinase [Deltaproteobacteria bacterium]